MRIVIDLQGAQTESRFRGIGRYTMSFAQAIARNCGEHEVIIALNGLFSDTIDPIRAAFDGLLPQKNICIWHTPGPVAAGHPGNDTRRKVAELIREAFLTSLAPDVIHCSSLFEGYCDDAVTSIGLFDTTTPVSVSLYDLIPLLNPKYYLDPNPRYANYYRCKLEYLKRAKTLLAISEFTQREGMAHLDVTDSRVINVSTAIDACFRPLTLDGTTIRQLRKRFGLTRPFILYTGGADERKNLPRLIQAYASLPATLRAGHQLLLAGKMPEGNIGELKYRAKSVGLKPDELCFTGYVTDAQLVQLYNLCQLFIFPSWHEGFGLPALEAMGCGAPVIGANTSSLPEVIGLEMALFDPLDFSAMTTKMVQVLQDEVFRATLSNHGLEQAKKFSWDESAKRAIAAFSNLKITNLKSRANWIEINNASKRIYNDLVYCIAEILSKHQDIQETELISCANTIAKNVETLDKFHRSLVLPTVISWRLEGPFDSSYSLALLNRETALALDKIGQNVALHSTEGPGDFIPNSVFLRKNTAIAALYERSKVVTQDVAHVVSRNLYPPRVSDMECRLNLLHSYAWEESGFPSEWVDQFNEHLQGITCLSHHVEKVMIDNGVTVPLSVSGCGVDHWERIKVEAKYEISSNTFRFLHVSSCFPRKGADVLLQAYGMAFNASDDVTLIIKTFKNPHNKIHCWLAEARANNNNYPKVQIIEEDLSDSQLKSLYMQCHALVAPSRAEGFGLPMAEAMLVGLPVITTGWSGQLDFCNSETAWLVDYSFEPARAHFDLFDSVWAEPDLISLAKLMQEVYEMPSEQRKLRPFNGRRLLLEKFRWTDVASRLVNSARTWARVQNNTELSIGWVTTWNTTCGVATYSAHLIADMPSNITILAPHSSRLTQLDDKWVSRCWTAGDDDDLENLSCEIEQRALNVLVIQFNYGFFQLEAFGEFIDRQVDAGKVVLITFHSTTDPIHQIHKQLKLLCSSLSRCQRLLVHSVNDLNRLKSLGLVENVTLFPHGLLDFNPANTVNHTAVKQDRLTIASYGFFLPHKGLLELIEACALLRKRGMDMSLRMINAEYPSEQSAAIINVARKRITSLGMSPYITINTRFLEDKDSLTLLHEADLIVFPYQNTGESASGAVRYGLASGRPVAVTPLDIFDDIKPVVHYLPGQSANDIADGISSLWNDIQSGVPYVYEIEKKANRWRTAHLYSKISHRLYGILVALRRSSQNL